MAQELVALQSQLDALRLSLEQWEAKITLKFSNCFGDSRL
jgi:hypothetical protein